jgi:hypothetical protein
MIPIFIEVRGKGVIYVKDRAEIRLPVPSRGDAALAAEDGRGRPLLRRGKGFRAADHR